MYEIIFPKFHLLTHFQVNRLLRKGLVNPKQICERCLRRAKAIKELNVFITETPAVALQQADAALERHKGGRGKIVGSFKGYADLLQ